MNRTAGRTLRSSRLLDDLQKQLGGKKDELARLQEAYQHDRNRDARDEKDRLVAEVASLRQKIENLEKDACALRVRLAS
nr:hypothetical protein [Geobacter sp.]